MKALNVTLLSVLLVVLGSGAAADTPESTPPRCELGIEGGFFLPDEDLSNKDSDFQELEPTGGVRFGVNFARMWDWFVDVSFADINTNTAAADVESLSTRTGFDFYFRPHGKKVQWFVGAGLGFADFDAELVDDFDRNFASLGVGQRVRLDNRANFRWELRGDQIFENDDVALFDGQDFTRIQAMIGVHWGLGRTDKDSDGDGVYDSRDQCPDTPRGAIVDEVGCPLDSDGDGVYDGIDKCPDTPRGAIVDEWGCPKDSDGDGVYDGIDKCPNTPRGATVDEWGCPRDSDGDGVFDGIDRCPDTPRGAIVDEWGCPKDSDGDGVYDGIDQCPDTPPGTPVRPDGCPKEAPLFTEEKKTLILEGVFFEFDSAVLKPESRATLDRVSQSLLDWPDVRVEVAGHTDWIGDDAYNLNLSGRRAASVRDYLIGKGVAAARLTARGYGETEPIADNHSKSGRAKNRRVELQKLD